MIWTGTPTGVILGSRGIFILPRSFNEKQEYSIFNFTLTPVILRYLKKEGIKTDQDFVVPDDLLFSRLNGTIEYVGNCAVVKSGYPDNLLYPDRLYCAKLVETSLASYCEYFFSSPFVRKRIEEKAKSTAGHKRISIPDITDLEIKVASIAEMDEIVLILDSQTSVIQKHLRDIENNLLKSETLRQSILKKAFSGQLVPQNADDEPAHLLLERIAEEKAAIEAKAKQEKIALKKIKANKTIARKAS